MGIVSSFKAVVRSKIGLWPAMEMWNLVTMAPALPRLIQFENKEVTRLRSELGVVPTARIACIIPTFKRPDRLMTAINSILAQDCQDFVIMVVDDGGGLFNLPRDPRIFPVSLSRNCAVAGLVRNVGIRLSNSEFIAFLDDDNTWKPQHLSLAIRAVEGGADLVYTAVRRLKPDGSQLDILSKPFNRRRFSDESAWVDTNAIVLRRSACPLFSRLPRTRKTLPLEDWQLVWRVSSRARVEHVPAITVEYLVNPESHYTIWSDTG